MPIRQNIPVNGCRAPSMSPGLSRSFVQSGKYRQRGAMTLLISLVLLTLITMVSLYTAHTVSMEQKISANEFRSRVAFEAAEAGLEAGLVYVDTNNGGADRDGDNSVTDENIFNNDGTIKIGTVTGDTTSRTFSDASGNTTSKVTATLTANADMTNFTITATGTTADDAASRTVTRVVAIQSPIPDVPGNAVTARGSIGINGSATIHNPEGASTILSGADVDLGSNAATKTEIASPQHASYPACTSKTLCSADTSREGCAQTCSGNPCDTGYAKCSVVEASNTAEAGVDVREHDSTLASMSGDEFFEFIFGMKPSEYKNQSNVFQIEAADFCNNWTGNPVNSGTDPGADLAAGKVIWVDGDVDCNGSVTVGCTADVNNQKSDPFERNCENAGGTLKPSIVIIDGSLDVAAGSKFFGLVYVMGNIEVTGNVEVQGAMATQGDNTTTTGSLDIWYDSGILEDLIYAGSTSGTSGTWKDF